MYLVYRSPVDSVETPSTYPVGVPSQVTRFLSSKKAGRFVINFKEASVNLETDFQRGQRKRHVRSVALLSGDSSRLQRMKWIDGNLGKDDGLRISISSSFFGSWDVKAPLFRVFLFCLARSGPFPRCQPEPWVVSSRPRSFAWQSARGFDVRSRGDQWFVVNWW